LTETKQHLLPRG